METKPAPPNLKLILTILLPSLVLVVILSLSLREFVRQSIIMPLAFVWSLLAYLFSSTPQVLFWAIFVLISVIIIGKVILGGKEPPLAMPTPQHEDNLAPGRDRIYHWSIQVQLALHGNLYFRDRVMRSLERLVMGVIAYQERLTVKEVEEALAHRSLEVPADINKLFDYQRPQGLTADGDLGHRLAFWFGKIKAWFSRFKSRNEPGMQYQQLEEIVDYLETQLEIKHDG